MFRHEVTMVVDRPIDEVAAFWQDFAFNLPRGRGITLGIRPTSAGPTRVGSTFQQRLSILGFETKSSGTIIEWDPPHGARIALNDEGIIRSGAIWISAESTPAGTKVTRGAEVEPRGLMKLVLPFIAPLLRRRIDAGNERLRQLFLR